MDTQKHTLITDLMKRVAELENKLNHLHNIVQKQTDLNITLLQYARRNQKNQDKG